jgi:ABC-type dipeptide/oligopeptide/nickel transport system permease component
MVRVVAAKLVGAIAAMFGASIISFTFLRVLPGNPARLILGPLASRQAIHEQENAMGLHDSVLTQYWNYVSGFFTGDWGFSYSAGQPVTKQLGSRLPASIELGLYAFGFAFVLAVLLALLCTYRHRPIVDATVRGLSFLGLGTPPFWFGLVALLVFSQYLPILPGPDGRLGQDVLPPPSYTHLYTIDALLSGQWSTCWDAFEHLILPAITLGLAPFAFLVRLLRANLLEVSREHFLVVVRSKGVDRWTTHSRHALPNAFLPTLTAGGLLLAQLIAGSVLVEKVFNWPGVGALIVDSVLRQDFAVVQTFILLSAFSYVVVNLVIDLLYGVVDPRVRVPSAVG